MDCEAVLRRMERSTASGFLDFTRMLYMEGVLEHDHYIFAERVWKEYNKMPDIIVYLETPVAVCFERLRQRDRPEELGQRSCASLKGISREYLEKLEQAHEQYLLYMKYRT